MHGNLSPSYVKYYGNSAETKIQGKSKLLFYLLDSIKFFIFLKNYFFIDSFEEYEITFPGLLVRGILFGTLVMELTGKTFIKCEKTGYIAELEFKPKVKILTIFNLISF